MSFNRDSLLLYAVTDRLWAVKQTLSEQIESALEGGVTCVQLREKSLDESEFLKEAFEVKKLCRRFGVPLIINDNLEVALKCGADGVHAGIEDLPVSEIRRIAGKNFIIGATAKTVVQAKKAEADGADYLGVGAVFASATKTNAIRITQDELKTICASVSIPSVAIGGITYENMGEIQGCGIRGIAVVSALFSADDIKSEAQKLKKAAFDTVYKQD